jgi:hypothetical protein
VTAAVLRARNYTCTSCVYVAAASLVAHQIHHQKCQHLLQGLVLVVVASAGQFGSEIRETQNERIETDQIVSQRADWRSVACFRRKRPVPGRTQVRSPGLLTLPVLLCVRMFHKLEQASIDFRQFRFHIRWTCVEVLPT